MSGGRGKEAPRPAGSEPRPEAPGEALSLEERLRRLDAIVAGLEGGGSDLEEGLRLFEEGVRHIREAERLLAAAELRVEELVGRPDALETRPLEDSE